MIRRPPRSTPLYSSAASDVYKRQVSDSFVQLTPWCLHLADVRVYCGTACSLRPVRATYALVGSIVGLAIIGSEVALPNCLGLGIVRSFNFQSKVLYILTPLASTQLSVVDALVVRDVNLPLAFKMIRKALVPQSPHESCNGLASEGTGAGMIRSRNNFCLLYTSPSPRDATLSRMPSSA